MYPVIYWFRLESPISMINENTRTIVDLVFRLRHHNKDTELKRNIIRARRSTAALSKTYFSPLELYVETTSKLFYKYDKLIRPIHTFRRHDDYKRVSGGHSG